MMKKINKILHIFLAAVILLSSFPVNAAVNTGGYYTHSEMESFLSNKEFLQDTKIASLSQNIDATVKRREWANILVNYFGYTGINTDEHYFSDYKKEDVDTTVINTVAFLGLMSAFDNGGFCPDEDVSYEVAVASMVKGLGYSISIENSSENYQKYIGFATKLGLLKGMSASIGYPITCGDAVTLLMNGLEVDLLEKQIGGKSSQYEISDGKTILSSVLKLEKCTGVVTGNKYTGLYSGDEIREGCISIDNKVYEYNGRDRSLLGYRVQYYIDPNVERVVFITPYLNETKEINGNDIFDYKNRVYQYEDDKGKSKKIEIPQGCAIIYNNKAMTDNFLSQMPMYTEDSKLLFIDNNNDNKDDVLIIEAYTNFVVESINSVDQILYDKLSKNTLFIDDYDVVEIFDIYGSEISFPNISLLNVLSVAAAPDNTMIRIVVADGNYTGEVTSISKTDDTCEIKIDDDLFETAESCTDTDKLRVGFYGVFYTDRNGKIAYFEERINIFSAYLIDAGINGKGVNNRLELKICNSSGKIEFLNCADKIDINEERKTDCEKIFAMLKNPSGEVVSQVILYELNADGEVKSIDIADSQRFRMYSKVTSNSKYRSNAACFVDGKTFLNGGAKIFFVPSNPKEAADADFAVGSASTLKNDEEYASASMPITSYQLGESKLGADILVINESYRKSKYYIGVVGAVSKTKDSEGEFCDLIKIYQYSNLNDYMIYDDSGIDVNAVPASYSGFNETAELHVGDVVSFDYFPYNSGRRIVRLVKLLDIQTKKVLTNNPNVAPISADSRHLFGSVHEKYGNLVGMVIDEGNLQLANETSIGENTNLNAGNYETHNLKGASFYKFDDSRKKGNVVRVKIAEVLPYTTVGSEYSKIFILSDNETVSLCYIYQ